MYEHLNNYPNLQPRLYKRGPKRGQRKTGPIRKDEIGIAMAGMTTAGEIADLAAKFGISQIEIEHRAKTAAHFGQFRVNLDNRIRGILNKLAVAQETGSDLSIEDAAAMGIGQQFIKE